MASRRPVISNTVVRFAGREGVSRETNFCWSRFAGRLRLLGFCDGPVASFLSLPFERRHPLLTSQQVFILSSHPATVVNCRRRNRTKAKEGEGSVRNKLPAGHACSVVRKFVTRDLAKDIISSSRAAWVSRKVSRAVTGAVPGDPELGPRRGMAKQQSHRVRHVEYMSRNEKKKEFK